MSQTWILVADGSNARLFDAPGNNAPWVLAKTLKREHSREKTNLAEVHEDRGEHDFARLLAAELDRKSTRLNSSHCTPSRMPSSA